MDYGPLLCYLGTSTAATDKEFRGVARTFMSLRVADTKCQLPAARAIVDWMARLLSNKRVFLFSSKEF